MANSAHWTQESLGTEGRTLGNGVDKGIGGAQQLGSTGSVKLRLAASGFNFPMEQTIWRCKYKQELSAHAGKVRCAGHTTESLQDSVLCIHTST